MLIIKNNAENTKNCKQNAYENAAHAEIVFFSSNSLMTSFIPFWALEEDQKDSYYVL